jgi:ribonuclease VapC
VRPVGSGATIVLDTSALMAVVLGEPDGERYVAALIEHAGNLALSAANLVEARIVAESRRGQEGEKDLRYLLLGSGVVVVDLDESQAGLAVQAWRRFGKGRHPAGLNLADCFAYGLTVSLGARLLFKGNDFRQTDVAAVLP